MCIIALWVVVLAETGLLLALLRGLGQLRQQGALSGGSMPPLRNGGLPEGSEAPAFDAVDLGGNHISLDDFQGRRRILAFVSPQCSACSATIEALNAVMRAEPDLAVVTIGGTDRDLNRAYAAEHDARMPFLTPASDEIREMYRVQSIPYAFALDEAGIIRAAGIVNAKEHIQGLIGTAYPTAAVH